MTPPVADGANRHLILLGCPPDAVSLAPPITPIEILLETAAQSVKGNRTSAMKAAKAAAPYMGMTAEGIIEALGKGETVDQLLAQRDAKMLRQGLNDLIERTGKR